jgi:hypothetical protein
LWVPLRDEDFSLRDEGMGPELDEAQGPSGKILEPVRPLDYLSGCQEKIGPGSFVTKMVYEVTHEIYEISVLPVIWTLVSMYTSFMKYESGNQHQHTTFVNPKGDTMANAENTQTESNVETTEVPTTLTPIMLAHRLDAALRPITGNKVPPQMVYNYLTNDVRKLRTKYSNQLVVRNKDGKSVNRTVFTEEKATEFVTLMVTAARARQEKKAREAEENAS